MEQMTDSLNGEKKYFLRRREFSILVAQSEQFTCEVLSQLLKEQGYNVVGRAVEMNDTLQQIRVKRPQCVILDAEISGRQGFDIVRQSQTDDQRTKFILYTSRPDLHLIANAMQTGFFGFLYASDGLEELYQCFQTVSNGGCYYSTGFMSLLKNYGVEVLKEDTRQQLSRLSDREREVLRLISQGLPGDEIARMLHISYRTLSNHKTNIAKKLNVGSCRQLTRYGITIKNYLL
ncbi:response regulator transcription factor [Nibrella viscosa]|uniref:Response regulator transcription factor n=1 Tax=Nibrella viscosa TaxID=1084524 RepID=A0ABP8KTT4_9BACT